MMKEGAKLIERMEKEGCLEDAQPYYTSPFFVVKQGEKYRFIHDLSSLTDLIQYQHFRMQTLKVTLTMISPNCWMTRIDITRAYWHVLIHPKDRKYLQFIYNGRLRQWTCAMFGLAHMPRIFTRIMKVIQRWCAGKDIIVIIYIDDILLIDTSRNRLQKATLETVSMMRELGWTINEEKCVLTPTQETEFLGAIINSQTMQVTLPERKLKKTLKEARRAINNRKIPLKQLARIIGLIRSADMAFPIAKFKTNRLQSLLRTSRQQQIPWKAQIALDSECREELQWLINNMRDWNGKDIIPRQPTKIVEGDASLMGFGGAETKTMLEFGNNWTEEELQRLISSNRRELETFAKWLEENDLEEGDVVEYHSDNMTAISYINRQGGTIEELNEIARRIWNMAVKAKAWVQARYLPGRYQVIADPISRRKANQYDWALSRETFNYLTVILGSPQVDLFATNKTAKCPQYVAWFPEDNPRCVGVDALQLNWTELVGERGRAFANPPFSLIPHVLQHIQMENIDLILVVPHWETAPWMPLLKKLATRGPIMLGTIDEVSTLPNNKAELPGPELRERRMSGWLISAKDSHNKDMRKEPSM